MRSLLLLSFCIWSCSGESVPKEVLPPQKMEAVLYDLINADELVDFSSILDSSFRSFSKRSALYDSISNIHSISKETFQKSWQYYQGRPDLLKNILESLHKKTDTASTKRDSTIKIDSTFKRPTIREVIKPQ